MTPPKLITATDPERAIEVLSRENEALAAMLSALEGRMPTTDEMDYLRAAKLQNERASWVWRGVKSYLPWVTTLIGAVVSAVWWVANHISIKGP